MLTKALFRRAFQFALSSATNLVARNRYYQYQYMVSLALSDVFQVATGCLINGGCAGSTFFIPRNRIYLTIVRSLGILDKVSHPLSVTMAVSLTPTVNSP